MPADLPVEILQIIFYSLAYSSVPFGSVSRQLRDLLSFSHVCSLWRSAALRASPSWGCVLELSKRRSRSNPQRSSSAFDEVFKRTGGATLLIQAILGRDSPRLTLSLPSGDDDRGPDGTIPDLRWGKVLKEFSDRIGLLKLMFTQRMPEEDEMGVLREVLGRKAGALKALWVAFDPDVLDAEGAVRLSGPRPVSPAEEDRNASTNNALAPTATVPAGLGAIAPHALPRRDAADQHEAWTLFSEHAPHLQRIHLQNCLFDFHPSVCPSNVFANLTSFQLVITRNLPAGVAYILNQTVILAHHHQDDGAQGAAVTVDFSWIEVFRAMPHLETLHLVGLPPEVRKPVAAGGASGEQEVVKFAKLRDLAIVSHTTMMDYLTKRIEIPSLPSSSSSPSSLSVDGDGYGIPGVPAPKCYLSLNITLPPEPNSLRTYGVNFVEEKFRGRTGGVKEVKLKMGDYSLAIVALHYEEGRSGLPKAKRKELGREEGDGNVSIEDSSRIATQDGEPADSWSEEDVDTEADPQHQERRRPMPQNQHLAGTFDHPDASIDLSSKYTSRTQLSFSLAHGLSILSQHALSDFLSALSTPSPNSASGVVAMFKNAWKVDLVCFCQAAGSSFVNGALVSNQELLENSLVSIISLFVRAKRLVLSDEDTIKKVVIPILQAYPPVIASEHERQLYYCYNHIEKKKDTSLLPILFPNVTVIEVREECLDDDAVMATLEAYEIWRKEMGRPLSIVAVES